MRVELKKIPSDQGWLLAITVNGRQAISEGPRPSDARKNMNGDWGPDGEWVENPKP